MVNFTWEKLYLIVGKPIDEKRYIVSYKFLDSENTQPSNSTGDESVEKVNFLDLLNQFIAEIDSTAVVEENSNNLSISSNSGNYKDIIVRTCSLVSLFFEKGEKGFNINFSLGGENYNIESLKCVEAKDKYEPGSRGFELTVLNDLN